MDYLKLYNNIINKRRLQPLLKHQYGERHHIIPKSLGGNDLKENIIKLTGREHFLCHYLLTKIYKDDNYSYKKVLAAFTFFQANPTKHNTRYFNSRLYEKAKQDYSLLCKNRIGKNNTNYGYKWIKFDESKVCMKLPEIDCYDYIEQGWKFGRNVTYKSVTKYLSKTKKQINRSNIKKKRIQKTNAKYLKIYTEFKNSGLNWSQYCDKYNIDRANTWRSITVRILNKDV